MNPAAHELRDAVGAFTRRNGGFKSAEDRRLVDYQPWRPLGRHGSEETIGRIIPGARWVGYAETPFFRQLLAAQGTPEAGLTGEQDDDARTALFNRQPIENVPVDASLTFTQPNVNRWSIFSLASHKRTDELQHPAFVVRHEGRLYVVDGHHRILAAALRHETSYPARVLDL